MDAITKAVDNKVSNMLKHVLSSLADQASVWTSFGPDVISIAKAKAAGLVAKFRDATSPRARYFSKVTGSLRSRVATSNLIFFLYFQFSKIICSTTGSFPSVHALP